MGTNTGLFSSSLGKKYLMAITGLFLCSFLIIHFLGNIALFTNPVQFNEYTRFMSSNPIIRVMEIVLVLGFLTHIIDAIILTRANKKAQPVKYAMNKNKSSWYSRNMGLTGTIILVFLILHLQSFWYEYKFGEVLMTVDSNGDEIKDMFKINGFKIKTYNQYGFKQDAKTDTCPICSENRKKKKDKCVMLDWERGLATCQHCGNVL